MLAILASLRIAEGPGVAPRYLPPLGPFVRVRRKLAGSYERIQAARHELVRDVARTVLEFERTHRPAMNGAWFRSFWTAVFDRFAPFVATLNYDDSIEWAVGDRARAAGFVVPAGDALRFSRAALTTGEPVVVHVHGDLRFGWAGPDGRRLGPPAVDYEEVLRFREPERAIKTWDLGIGTIASDSSVLPEYPVVLGLRKPEYVLREPFASYYHALRAALLETPRWLIVGYGLADPHINALLHSGVALHGDALRLAVVGCASLESKSRWHVPLMPDRGFGVPAESLHELLERLGSRDLLAPCAFPDRRVVSRNRRVAWYLGGARHAAEHSQDELFGFLTS